MFDRLTKLIPPPSKPVGVPTLDEWQAIENKLGVQFPLGFFEFSQVYGAGSFRGTTSTDIGFYYPGGSNFLEDIEFECQRYRDENDSSDNEAIPFPIYPEEQGVLPLAIDRNDNHVYWRSIPKDLNWQIIVQWAWGRASTKEFRLPFPEFIEKLFCRELKTVCWQEPWFVDNVQFYPQN